MPFFAQEAPVEGYDRDAASRLPAGLAFPGLFPVGPVDAAFLGPPRQIQYRTAALAPEPGRHLTLPQQTYLRSYMQPCPAEFVTSATETGDLE